MLAALRIPARQIALRAATTALPRAGAVSLSRCVNARALSTEVPVKGGHIKGPRFFICMNCRREGHLTSECTQPTICKACGVEGHERKNCPNPDPARLEAMKTAPIECFRCGEAGHGIRDCPQPAKCFTCGSTEHQQKACPSYVPKPRTPRAKAQAPAA